MAIAIKKGHEGNFHRYLGISGDKKIPLSRIHAALNSKNARVRKMANFARNARKWNHKKGDK